MKQAVKDREVYFAENIEEISQILSTHCLWIIDDIFKSHFENLNAIKYFVSSGEQLKNVYDFPGHIEAISRLTEDFPTNDLNIVAVGGGSVGDFAGFVASILRRGVKLIHIPTTWLSLVDSSHGGKTALNIGFSKNQIGTFYPANKVIAIKPLLLEQPKELMIDALAEIIKASFLQGGDFFDFILKEKNNLHSNPDLIWQLVSKSIETKYQYIDTDPFEKKGIRTELNLGHTYAHALELLIPLSHGKAVGQGLHFSLDWSLEKKYLTKEEYTQAKEVLDSFGHKKLDYTINEYDWLPIVKKDKKRSSDTTVQFVFLKKLGEAIVESVSFDEMIDFAKEHQWLT